MRKGIPRRDIVWVLFLGLTLNEIDDRRLYGAIAMKRASAVSGERGLPLTPCRAAPPVNWLAYVPPAG
jgi:hypothetical protein